MKILVSVQDKTSQQPVEPALLDTEVIAVGQFVREHLDENTVIIFRQLHEVEPIAPEP